MQDKDLNLIVSEYNILWEALKHYRERLDKMSSMTTNEDQEISYDEKIQDIDGLLESIRISAKNKYDLDLS